MITWLRSNRLMALLLTLATAAQLADLYTWKLLLGRFWVEDGYWYRSVELNPAVNSFPEAGGELVKLALIVWALSFAALAKATNRWSILPEAVLLALFLGGLVGALSNVRAIL